MTKAPDIVGGQIAAAMAGKSADVIPIGGKARVES